MRRRAAVRQDLAAGRRSIRVAAACDRAAAVAGGGGRGGRFGRRFGVGRGVGGRKLFGARSSIASQPIGAASGPFVGEVDLGGVEAFAAIDHRVGVGFGVPELARIESLPAPAW